MKAQTVTRILTIFSLIAVLGSTFLFISPTSAATRIFEDGFETGDFSKWDVVRFSPTITSGGTHSGTYKAVLDAEGEYAQAQFLDTPVDHAFMRAYVMFKSFPVSGAQTTILGLHNFLSTGDVNRYISEARVINVAGTVKWELQYYDNGVYHGAVSELIKPVLDTWYCVEVEGKSNTSTDAESKIYINGHELWDVSKTGKNNDVPINGGYIWAMNVNAPVRWYDDVVIDSTYIGPILPVTFTSLFIPLISQGQ